MIKGNSEFWREKWIDPFFQFLLYSFSKSVIFGGKACRCLRYTHKGWGPCVSFDSFTGTIATTITIASGNPPLASGTIGIIS